MSDERTTEETPIDASQVRYDQARYVENGQYEPLLSEKDLTRVAIGDADAGEDGAAKRVDSPLPDDLTRDSLELPVWSRQIVAWKRCRNGHPSCKCSSDDRPITTSRRAFDGSSVRTLFFVLVGF